MNRQQAAGLRPGDVVRAEQHGKRLTSYVAVVTGELSGPGDSFVPVEYADGHKGRAWYGRLTLIRKATHGDRCPECAGIVARKHTEAETGFTHNSCTSCGWSA